MQRKRAEEGFFDKCGDGCPSFFACNSNNDDLLHEVRDSEETPSSLQWLWKTTKTRFPDVTAFLVSYLEKNSIQVLFDSTHHCVFSLPGKERHEKSVVLFFKEAHYQLTGLVSACFSSNLLFEIIFFCSLVWLGSTGKGGRAETYQPLASFRSRIQFWEKGGSDLPQKLETSP